jgi:DNA-binding PadR family transcriptional regulator
MANRIRMTPVFFHILLALAGGPRHGYALLQEIDRRARGRVKLGPSSLYWALGRLEEAHLIGEVASPEKDKDDERRRYWQLTEYGRDRLRAELATLTDVLEHARIHDLLPDHNADR